MSHHAGLIDLAAERVGGRAILANDEFFAPKENLLKPGRGVLIAGKLTDRGFWMDGWETRRRREPGHDWCIVQLGIPGVIRAVTVDTNHFKGNHPEACSLDAATLPGEPPPNDCASAGTWSEILPRSSLRSHSENDFEIRADARYSHVRLNIYPDGGVARLRIWGAARPDWERMAAAGGPIDLVAIAHGGLPLACSDQFFGEPINLIMPGPPADMADGWETRRRRGPGHDWVVVQLAHRGVIEEVEVDTTHFKGNFPESCSLEATDGAPDDRTPWRELLRRTKLSGDTRHRFRRELLTVGPVSHVRFNMYPDGGVARLRLFGRLVEPT